MPNTIDPSCESADRHRGRDPFEEALVRLDDWFRAEDRLARVQRSPRRQAAVFYAWTRVRRPAAMALIDADKAITEAERLLAYFLSDEGWATTPPGRLDLGATGATTPAQSCRR